MESGESDETISAYAKLEFQKNAAQDVVLDTAQTDDITANLDTRPHIYYIQTLSLVLGRKTSPGNHVDVHLGTSKSISKSHAKIFYHFDAMCWMLEVRGRNGAFINECFVEAGSRTVLKNADQLLIGEADLLFLLPRNPEVISNPKSSLSADRPLITTNGVASTKSHAEAPAIGSTDSKPRHALVPIAPHHLMARSEASKPTVHTSIDAQNPLETTTTTTPLDVYSQRNHSSSTGAQINAAEKGPNGHSDLYKEHTTAQKTLTLPPHNKTTTNVSSTTAPATLDAHRVQLVPAPGTSQTPSLKGPTPQGIYPSSLSQTQGDSGFDLSEEEMKMQQEEEALLSAASAAHQEQLARQAIEEEQGLTLPPAETDPAVIAALEKPTVSYATMIFLAINSHEKKKMSLNQIYSWVAINYPYYRYQGSAWQNSIRHNLSLNGAFNKISRLPDEPGKGCFWTLDPNADMRLENGNYKKKVPRSAPSAPVSHRAPVVMRNGRLALNPNYFVGASDLHDKATEVLDMLQIAVQKQLGHGETEEKASVLSRILGLALATKLRQDAVPSAATRVHQVASVPRAAGGHSLMPLQHASHLSQMPTSMSQNTPLVPGSSTISNSAPAVQHMTASGAQLPSNGKPSIATVHSRTLGSASTTATGAAPINPYAPTKATPIPHRNMQISPILTNNSQAHTGARPLGNVPAPVYYSQGPSIYSVVPSGQFTAGLTKTVPHHNAPQVARPANQLLSQPVRVAVPQSANAPVVAAQKSTVPVRQNPVTPTAPSMVKVAAAKTSSTSSAGISKLPAQSNGLHRADQPMSGISASTAYRQSTNGSLAKSNNISSAPNPVGMYTATKIASTAGTQSASKSQLTGTAVGKANPPGVVVPSAKPAGQMRPYYAATTNPNKPVSNTGAVSVMGVASTKPASYPALKTQSPGTIISTTSSTNPYKAAPQLLTSTYATQSGQVNGSKKRVLEGDAETRMNKQHKAEPVMVSDSKSL